MKSNAELAPLAQKYGWKVKPLTYREVRAMAADEYRWHELNNADALAAALNEDATKGIIEQGEARSRLEQVATAFQTGLGMDSETLDRFREAVTEFEKRHAELDFNGPHRLVNGKILADYMTANNLDICNVESLETAYRALGGRSAFHLSVEAQQAEDEKRMGADEYKKSHPELAKERYFDPLRNEIRTRGVPDRVLARWDIMLKTFLATEPRYIRNEANKKAMIGYIKEHNLDLSLINLQTAFAELTKAGKLVLRQSPEEAAKRGGSQTTVLHDLGGSAPGYPLYYAEYGKQSFRRLVAEMSSEELRRRCQIDSQFRKAVDGLNED